MSETPKKSFKRHTVTSALPYANGPLHLGHFAGAYLPADIYVRYLRAKGEDVVFICGTDEHGAAISKRAKQEGIQPVEVVDKYHKIIKKTFEDFKISFDNFSRTSREIHHETAQEFFKKFHDEGKLVKKTIQQLYDEKAEMFLADRFVTGTCPKCSNPEAYGDQCEKCGSSLDPSDLINPVSTITGSTPVMRETTHWYLPLDQYDGFLRDYILEGHKEWKANVYGQCKSWLTDGLQPRSITRDLDWGVKVPVEGGEGKVLYVWFDAPIGYISSTKEWAKREGKEWEPYWKDEDTRLIHFIGKDNIVFHCIIFPSILKGYGDGYILPDNVPANEFLNLEGKKFSTSKNWAVWLHEFVADHPDKIDVMRYVLTHIMPENSDVDFTWEQFAEIQNTTLADSLGNLINRVLVLSHKSHDGKVPTWTEGIGDTHEVVDQARAELAALEGSLEKFRFKEALNHWMSIARIGNKYMTETEPWKLFKTEPARAANVLYNCAQICALLTVAGEPFVPLTSEKLRNAFGISDLKWMDLDQDVLIPSGQILTKIPPLFPKLDKKFVEAEVEKLKKNQESAASKVVPAKEETTFDAFQEMDLRVCTIVSAEKVKKANRLLKLIVNTGLDQRTVVSGIAEHFNPEELVGKQAVILINLKPRKIRGVESQGMLLFAEDSSGKLHRVAPVEEVENGAQIS